MSPSRKIIVTGPARSGKDTVSELLARNHALRFASTSRAALERAVLPVLGDAEDFVSHHPQWAEELDTVIACRRRAGTEGVFDGRRRHRALWYALIAHYNREDAARLGREVLHRNDILCGLRNRWELAAMRRAVPEVEVWWVSRPGAWESSASLTIGPRDADVVVANAGSAGDLAARVAQAFEHRRDAPPA